MDGGLHTGVQSLHRLARFSNLEGKTINLDFCICMFVLCPGICRWLIEENVHVTNRQHYLQGLLGCNLRKTE